MKKVLKNVSTGLYLFVCVVALAMSAVCILAGKFFPYHAEASRMSWSEIDSGLQLVIMSLIRLGGMGWLAFALGLGFFTVYYFHKRNDPVAYFIIPVLILIYFGGVFSITFHVYNQTQASTPWASTAGIIGLDILAFFCSILSRRLSQGQQKEGACKSTIAKA